MTVNKRNLFGASSPFDDGVPDPRAVSGNAPSASHFGASTHGDESAFRSAQSRVTGEQPGGSAGFGIGGDTDSGFSTRAYNGSDSADQSGGKDIDVGTLVRKNYGTQGQSGDSGSDTSGYGKVIR